MPRADDRWARSRCVSGHRGAANLTVPERTPPDAAPVHDVLPHRPRLGRLGPAGPRVRQEPMRASHSGWPSRRSASPRDPAPGAR